MGGKKGFVKKPLGSVGDNIARELKVAARNVGTATVDIVKDVAMTTGQAVQDVGRNVGEGFGEITGANAAREQAMKTAAEAKREAKRQADISDALARNQGGDPTSIFLATGKKRAGRSGGGTGSAGTGSSRNTGVQS